MANELDYGTGIALIKALGGLVAAVERLTIRS